MSRDPKEELRVTLEPIKSSHQANAIAMQFHGTRLFLKSPEKMREALIFIRIMPRSV
jgi:hypothetical protein